MARIHGVEYLRDKVVCRKSSGDLQKVSLESSVRTDECMCIMEQPRLRESPETKQGQGRHMFLLARVQQLCNMPGFKQTPQKGISSVVETNQPQTRAVLTYLIKLKSKLLKQGLSNIFCEGPDSKYFRLYGPYGFSLSDLSFLFLYKSSHT